MAPSEDANDDEVNKKCKYCKSNVEKSGVRCGVCKASYHSSCALRMTGLQVASGSKNLILCPPCASASRSSEINKAVDEQLSQKEDEIKALRLEIAELQRKNGLSEGNINILHERMECIEKNIMDKLENMSKNVSQVVPQRPANVRIQSENVHGTNIRTSREQHESSITTKANGANKVESPGNPQHVNLEVAGAQQPANSPRPRPSNKNVRGYVNNNNQQDQINKKSQQKPTFTKQNVGIAIENAIARIPAPTPENREEIDEGNGWKTVRYKTRRQEKLSQNEINRPKPLKGIKQNGDCSLKAAQRKAYLFITGVAPDAKEENIMEYLRQCDIGNGCNCEKIKTKREKYCSSFKLTVPLEDRPKYLCTEIWPDGVTVNHFLNIQNQGRVFEKSQQPYQR